MARWTVERVVHFDPGDLVEDGFVHFGFHDRAGRQYAVEHQRHFIGPVGNDGRLEWTAAARPVFADVPNITAELHFRCTSTRSPTVPSSSRTSATPASTGSTPRQ